MSVINPLEMPAPVRSYFEAMNRYDRDGVVRAFAEDALVNDVQREFWGSESISRWTDKEIVGEKVIATKFVAARTHYGDTSSPPSSSATSTRPAYPIPWC
jgi:hypothetical protein